VITAVVAEALGFVDQTPSLEVKMELIKSLKDICAGNFDVESESAKRIGSNRYSLKCWSIGL